MTSDNTSKAKQDKAFEQILAIAREAGLLIFKTDEADEPYTDRVLIERPVEDKEVEGIIERAFLTEEGVELVKELREEGMDDTEIASLIRGNVNEE